MYSFHRGHIALVAFFISLTCAVRVPYSPSSIRLAGGISDDSSFNVVIKSASSGKCCSASLIAEQRVLFAGHCARSLEVGDYATIGDAKSPHFKLVEVHQHPGFGDIKNDIAVAKLNSPAVPGAKILPLSRVPPPADATVTLYGYGSTEAGSKGHSTLRKTDMLTMSLQASWEMLVLAEACKPARLLRTDIAVGSMGICDSDSRGALVYKRQQVGIAVVWTKKTCGDAKWPNIFTNCVTITVKVDLRFLHRQHRFFARTGYFTASHILGKNNQETKIPNSMKLSQLSQT